MLEHLLMVPKAVKKALDLTCGKRRRKGSRGTTQKQELGHAAEAGRTIISH
jgi:hypothetical protein